MNDNYILYTVRNFQKYYNNELEKICRDESLDIDEVNILLFLKNHPMYNKARDIVEYRGFSKAYVSKAISKLHDKDIISINTDEKDRRNQIIEINSTYDDLVNKFHYHQKSILSKLCDGIEEDEIKVMFSCIEKIRNNILKQI